MYFSNVGKTELLQLLSKRIKKYNYFNFKKNFFACNLFSKKKKQIKIYIRRIKKFEMCLENCLFCLF